ncbi:MAG: NADH:ubiquinone oxidoreductase subunit [Rickettsiaceae bacterium]|jgi:NADH-quinone oxidoreductase subunit M|nr:NADH:ubiquinone oxidoreductase subunit [Rickettsiaceae bacterium]
MISTLPAISQFPILSVLTFLPILGALLALFFIPSGSKNSNRNLFGFGLLVSLIIFALSIYLLVKFDKEAENFQFFEVVQLISGYDIKYQVGVDGISLLMILLTTFLTPICLLVSIQSVTSRVKEYVICFLLLEGFVIGSFVALDLVLFYIFFEVMLIPMFLIIGIWGGKNRIYAAFKFFLYTFFGSVLFLIAIIYIYNQTGTADILILKSKLSVLSLEVQKWLWLAFFISFAIKIPMFPFHTWLPDAHVQAPTAGSVILAGILIKLGAYGLLRFSLPLFPAASAFFTSAVFALSAFAIIYASIVALMQEDMKKMIAYSSVAHMGFITMGIFSMNMQGLQGAIIQMISHGLVSSALFLCVGVVYDRLHTREIADYGGLANKMPKYAAFMMVFTMAAVGLPGTSGFVGEFLSIIGTFQVSKITAIVAAFGVVLGATYMLWLYARVVFGEVKNEKVAAITDVNKIEFCVLLSLVLLVIAIGIYPSLALRYLDVSAKELVIQTLPVQF